MFAFKNILVTGGAGFIGANFIRYILGKYEDIKIVNLDKLTYAGNLKNVSQLANHRNHTFVHNDICEKHIVDDILRSHHIDTIVHFAAESHVDRSIASPIEFVKTNVVGTFTLLEAAYNYWMKEKKLGPNECRFHHISTDEVYGTLGEHDPAFVENQPYLPNSPYAASKASSDHFVRAFCQTYGLPVTTSNCSNNYGPFQHSEKFIPTVIRSCMQNKPIPIYGNGSNIRDWIFVEDHCEAIERILRQGRCGETYHVGGNNELSNNILARTICQLFNKISPKDGGYLDLISYVPDRLGHDWRYAINSQKALKELQWEPLTNLQEGLEKTIKYYISQVAP